MTRPKSQGRRIDAGARTHPFNIEARERNSRRNLYYTYRGATRAAGGFRSIMTPRAEMMDYWNSILTGYKCADHGQSCSR